MGRHAAEVTSSPGPPVGQLTTAVAHPGAQAPDAIAAARGLTKTYGSGATAVHALRGVDVDFARGRLTAIMGPSGSGKSTLMHCMAGLDSPTSGIVVVDGQDISRMRQRQLTVLRRTRIGFVFQAYNLVPTLTAAENITLPLDIARRPVDRERFDMVVDTLGLRDRLTHRPTELSGGQQQRVACARALVASPSIVFADEPTGNLDSTSAGEVLGFLRRSVDELGQSVVMVTHDPRSASYAHRVLFLADGAVVGELSDPTEADILAALAELGSAREQGSAREHRLAVAGNPADGGAAPGRSVGRTEAGVVESEVAAPGMVESDVAAPGMVEADVAAPGVVEADLAAPGVVESDVVESRRPVPAPASSGKQPTG